MEISQQNCGWKFHKEEAPCGGAENDAGPIAFLRVRVLKRLSHKKFTAQYTNDRCLQRGPEPHFHPPPSVQIPRVKYDCAQCDEQSEGVAASAPAEEEARKDAQKGDAADDDGGQDVLWEKSRVAAEGIMETANKNDGRPFDEGKAARDGGENQGGPIARRECGILKGVLCHF